VDDRSWEGIFEGGIKEGRIKTKPGIRAWVEDETESGIRAWVED
jgi:hypothetical protein